MKRLYTLLKKTVEAFNPLHIKVKTLEDKVDKPQNVLWSSDGIFMIETQTAELSEPISSQKNGIVLVWSDYDNGAINQNFVTTFIPKGYVSLHDGKGMSITLISSSFNRCATKYVYVSDNKITGNSINNKTGSNSGITYVNNKFVLREIIGV